MRFWSTVEQKFLNSLTWKLQCLSLLKRRLGEIIDMQTAQEPSYMLRYEGSSRAYVTVNSVSINPASFTETAHCLQVMQPSWHMLEYSSDFIVLSIFWCANLVFCIPHQWIVCGALIDTRITFGACDVLHSLLVERRKSPHPGTFQLNDASSILVDVLTNRSNVVVILIVVDVDDEWIIDECERLHPLKDAIEKRKQKTCVHQTDLTQYIVLYNF